MPDARYTPEMADEILTRMSNGTTLRQVCRDLGVPESSARHWVKTDKNGFAQKYHEARAMMVDCWADELHCVAYQPDMDPADKRVVTENLRWLLGKLAPKRFSERLLVSGDNENPIQHQLNVQIEDALDSLSSKQLDALVQFTSTLIEGERGGQ